MAGTATNFNPNAIIIGPGQLWANVAIPAAGARLTLATDGTPDTTANPGAVHLGHTAAGAKFGAKATVTDFFADEVVDPIRTALNTTEAHISADLIQMGDFTILPFLVPGQGTFTTGGTGTYNQVTGGTIAVSFTSIALIVPSVLNAGKFEVFQLYKAINTTGIDVDVIRKGIGKTSVNFKGYAVTSRAAVDTTWNRWSSIP